MSLTYKGEPVDVGVFPSVNSLMDYLRETKPLFTPSDWEPDVVEHYHYTDSWYGCRSEKKFNDMTKYGTQNTKALEELKEATTNPVCINKMRRGRKLWSDCGDDADVSRYFMGEWDCMSYKPLEPTPSQTIKVFVPASVLAHIDTEEMIRAGTVLVRKLCALSLEGYSIRLESGRVAQWARSFDDPEFPDRVHPYSILNVLIKGEEEDFDPARIAFALMEPIFSRGLAFSYAGRTRPAYGGDMATCEQEEAEELTKLALGDDYIVIPLFELCKAARHKYGQEAEQAIEDYIDRCLTGTLGGDEDDVF